MPIKGNAAPTPCPSEQAYRRHHYRGEEPCDGCKEAHRDYGAQHRPPAQSVSGVHIGLTPLGPGECGTVRGYRWHRKAGEDSCQPCKDAAAKEARTNYGKVTSTTNRKLLPCGTEAAHARHLRHGEQPCDPCRAAHSRVTNLSNKVNRIIAAMTRDEPTEAAQ